MFRQRYLIPSCVLLGLVFSLSIPTVSVAQESNAIIWRWSQPGVDLFTPSFSRDGNEIGLVRRTHWPDAYEAEQFSEAYLDSFSKRREEEPRWNDPEVIILTIGNSEPEFIDWGWSPSFGPDRSLIAYAHQKIPLSGRRVLASTILLSLFAIAVGPTPNFAESLRLVCLASSLSSLAIERSSSSKFLSLSMINLPYL